MFLLSQTEHWARCTRLSSGKEKVGKRGELLTFTIKVSESTDQCRSDDSVVAFQSGLVQSGQKKRAIAAVDGVPGKNKGMQVVEDSQSMPLMNIIGLSGDKIDLLGSVLLCILGKVNGVAVTFLIDTGANECFLSTTFVKKNKMKIAKAKEKLRIQLADGTMRVSNFIVE